MKKSCLLTRSKGTAHDNTEWSEAPSRLFAKRSTNALRRGDNRAPIFRVELRALEPACTASYVSRLMSSIGRKADMTIALQMSAYDPKRTSASSLKVVNFKQTRIPDRLRLKRCAVLIQLHVQKVTSDWKGLTMYSRLRIIISGAIVLMATSAALSKDSGLPQLDLQKQCRANQNATDALTGTKNLNAFDLCVKSEQRAREKLVARWTTIPPLDKTSCIHSTD